MSPDGRVLPVVIGLTARTGTDLTAAKRVSAALRRVGARTLDDRNVTA